MQGKTIVQKMVFSKAGIIYEDKQGHNMAYGQAMLGETVELYKDAVE